MSSYKTTSEVVEESKQGFINKEQNPYTINTWAYREWNRGYREASLTYDDENNNRSCNNLQGNNNQ